jgi:membrane protease YdiL (CAAX protease family)
MPTSPLPHPRYPSRAARLLALPLVRLLAGALAVTVPVMLTMRLVQHTIDDKALRQLWPQLLSAALCMAAYAWYVRKVERRAVAELSVAGAGRELGIGTAIGAGLILLSVGAIYAAGSFGITGQAPWSVMLKPFADLLLGALLEELLFRGIVFRIAEKSLGSLLALGVSAVVFAAVHMPNDNSTVLALAITAVAGVMFSAAYMATRRLWLPIGIHFAWNFMSEAVFSLPTSGHPASGLLQGRLSGPDWLSGGAYGIEGSLLTLAVIGATTFGLLALALRRGQWVAPYWRRPAP